MLSALDAGAEDVTFDDDSWKVVTEPSDAMAVRSGLEKLGIAIASTDITYLPQNLIELDKSEDARQVLAVMDALDDNDDVQGVYANFDISDVVLSELAAD